MRNDADLAKSRWELAESYRRMEELGLACGQAGNLSRRVSGGMLITPSGAVAGDMMPSDPVHMSLAGESAAGQLRPSSEWRLHAALYLGRPDVNAVAHCHSRYATVLACARRPIPALHYMIAVTGWNEVPVAPYATFGTEELARAVADTLGTGAACLLANHGQVAVAGDLVTAVHVACEVEELAALHWGCLAIGGPHSLSESDMAAVREAFADYGQRGRES